MKVPTSPERERGRGSGRQDDKSAKGPISIAYTTKVLVAAAARSFLFRALLSCPIKMCMVNEAPDDDFFLLLRYKLGP